MRRLTNSFSPAARAVSKPARSPRRMHLLNGVKRVWSLGYGWRRVREGKVCVVRR